MRYYISGKITEQPNFKDYFEKAEKKLYSKGHTVINPCKVEFDGLGYGEYLQIDMLLITFCDAIYMLKNWKTSKGAKAELRYAEALGKKVYFEEDYD